MKIVITLPDDIAEQVRRRPDRDEFVSRAVADALAQETPESSASPTGGSRWAQVAERIRRQSASLGDYHEKMKRDQEEFRRSFRFKHDEP